MSETKKVVEETTNIVEETTNVVEETTTFKAQREKAIDEGFDILPRYGEDCAIS